MTFFLNVSNSNIQIFSEKNKISEKKPKKLKDSGIIWDNVEHGSKGNNGSYGAAVGENTEKFVSLHRKPQENGLPRKRIFALSCD